LPLFSDIKKLLEKSEFEILFCEFRGKIIEKEANISENI
jgi:hypothetical protein